MPNRGVDDLALAILSRSTTLSHGGATPGVTAYQDRDGLASLVTVGGSSQILASGGAALTSVPTSGAYTWEGVQLLGDAGDFAGLTRGRFTLTTTFSGAATAAFSYTGGTTTAGDGTLTAGGNITSATGVLESSASGFSLAGVAASPITEGRLIGRFAGAGASAVSGVFTTTNAGGTRYAGGFVGGSPQIVVSTHEFTGTGDDGGFGLAGVTLDADTTRSRFVFVSNDLDAIQSEANVASDLARAASLLESIVTTGTFTESRFGGVTRKDGGSYAYKSGTLALDLYEADAGDARLFVIDGSSQTAESVIGYVARPRTGSIAAGAYTWEGAQLAAERSELHDTDAGRFRITTTITVGGTADQFTYATIGAAASQPFTLAGRGTINSRTGAFSATGLDFDPDGPGAAAVRGARLQGELAGDSAAALAGLFATTDSSATQYAGGFVAQGPRVARKLADGTGATGVAQADIAIRGAADKSSTLFVLEDIARLFENVNSPLDAARGATLPANVNPTGLPATGSDVASSGSGSLLSSLAQLRVRTGGAISYGTSSFTVVSYGDRLADAELLVITGTGTAAADSAIIATGRELAVTPSGGFTWKGVHFWTGAQGIRAFDATGASGIRTTSRTFTISGDFANARFTYATDGAAGIGTLAGSGTLNAASGRFFSDGIGFHVDASTTRTTSLHGQVLGGRGDGVSGVFATTATGSGVSGYVGGFIGQGPQDVAVLDRTAGVGRGRYGFLGLAVSTGTSDVLFAARNFDSIVNEANSAADARRGAALVAQFGTALTGPSTWVNDTYKRDGTLSYDGQSLDAESYRSWNDAGRLLLVDASGITPANALVASGGSAVSNIPTSGAYTWDGLHVWGRRSTLHDTTTGSFRITATFAGGGTNFIYTTTTSPAGAALSGTGTINNTTGVLSGDALSFAATAGGTGETTRLDGQLHGDGAIAISGLFATTNADGAKYSGGFVGAGPTVVDPLSIFTGDDVGIGRAELSTRAAGTAAPLVIVADNHAAFIASVNSASDLARGAAHYANLVVTPGTRESKVAEFLRISANTGETQSAVFGVGGTATTIANPTIYADTADAGRLIWINASGVSGLSSSLIATGAKFGGTPTGSFSYRGGYLWKRRGALDESAAFTVGSLNATADFDAASFTLVGQSTGAGSETRLNVTGGSLDVATGRISARAASFIFGTGTSKTHDAVVYGQVLGSGDAAASAISGTFATTAVGVGATNYIGGFLGSIQPVLEELYRFNEHLGTATGGIGRARNVLTGASARGIALVLVDGRYATVAREANNASSAVRTAALVANLDIDLSGATTTRLPAGNNAIVTRHATGSFTHAPGTGAGTSGGTIGDITVYQTLDGDARLLAIAGDNVDTAEDLYFVAGTGLSGALAGRYEWTGTHIVAQTGSLDSTPSASNEDRFTLGASFTAGASTAAFTYATLGTGSGRNVVAATGNIVVAGGAFSVEGGTFSLTPAGAGATAITSGRLFGQLFGARARAVAGVFATGLATGTNYVGAFVGAGQTLSRAHDDRANEWGIAEARNVGTLTGSPADTARITFVGADIAEVSAALSHPSEVTRRTSYAGAPVAIDGNADAVLLGRNVVINTGTTDIGGESQAHRLYRGGFGEASLVTYVGGAGRGPLAIAGGRPFSNFSTAASGIYRWVGAHVISGVSSTSFSAASTTTGEFAIELDLADVTNNSATAAYDASASGGYTLSGNLAINTATGVITRAGTDGFKVSTGQGASRVDLTTQIHGQLYGDGANAIAGAFYAHNGTDETDSVAGGFVGGGRSHATLVDYLAGATGAGHVTNAAGDIHFVSADVATLVPEANRALQYTATSADGFLRNLSANSRVRGASFPSLEIAGVDALSSYTGTITFNTSQSVTNSAYSDRFADAILAKSDVDGYRIVYAERKTQPGNPGALSGNYTYRGYHLRYAIGTGASRTTTTGAIELVATFTSGAGGDTFTYTTLGNTDSFNLASASGTSGTIDASGALSADNLVLDIDGSGTGANLAVKLRGTLAGSDAGSVSGVFWTTGASSTGQYAGGFVGQGPGDIAIHHTAGQWSIASTDVRFNGGADEQTVHLLSNLSAASRPFFSPNAQIRSRSAFANLNPAAPSGGTAATGTLNGFVRTTGIEIHPSGGAKLADVTRYHSSLGNVALLWVAGVSGRNDSFFALGGPPLQNIPSAANYTYDGVQTHRRHRRPEHGRRACGGAGRHVRAQREFHQLQFQLHHPRRRHHGGCRHRDAYTINGNIRELVAHHRRGAGKAARQFPRRWRAWRHGVIHRRRSNADRRVHWQWPAGGHAS